LIRSSLAIAICLAATGLVVVGSAGSQTISPVLVELSPARRVVSVTVTNTSDRPLTLQTETLSWTQANGEDRYEDTVDLIVAPPIAEIAPQASQIFRVALRRPAFGPDEQAYRLVLDDISGDSSGDAEKIGVSFRVRHNLPVFVAPAAKPMVRQRLEACPAANPPRQGCVRLYNDGNRYLQVKSLAIERGNGNTEIAGSSRVLAGAWRQWTFDLPAGLSDAVKVRAETAAGAIAVDLPVP
jgi:fimbrial chaperone protein